ncbi:MAG: K(+)-transporting ATPase subunit C [Clostridium sp.]
MVSSVKGVLKIIVFSLVLLLICGIIYPLAMTGISQVMFGDKANGSIVEVDGKLVGSEIIGQDFKDDRFMKCRPSAVNYNTYTEAEKASGEYEGVASGSTNLAPSNEKLKERVENDMEEFLKKNPSIQKEDIPADLLTASGSGLDPHISPKAAEIQIPALSKATGLDVGVLEKIVADNTQGKFLGIFGEKTVNVLKVNLDIAKELGIIEEK